MNGRIRNAATARMQVVVLTERHHPELDQVERGDERAGDDPACDCHHDHSQDCEAPIREQFKQVWIVSTVNPGSTCPAVWLTPRTMPAGLSGGVEWALPVNWFGSSAVTFSVGGTPVAVVAPVGGNDESEFFVARAKLNFKF
jgi:hypothetical protein